MGRLKYFRGITFFLAIWMTFSPLVVTAQSELELFTEINTSLSPLKRLNSVLKQNGAIDNSGNFDRQKFEAESWYQFMTFLTSAINGMGATGSDSAGFYVTLSKIDSLKTDFEGYKKLAKVTMLGDLATGLVKSSKLYSFARNLYISLLYKISVIDFEALELLKSDIDTSVKNFIKVAKVAEENTTGAKVLSFVKNVKNSKFVKFATSGFSLGFDIVGIALDGADVKNDEDLKIGNLTYSNIKSRARLGMGVLSLGLTLTGLTVGAVPVLGFCIWGTTKILDSVGERRKKWLEDYKDSYNFLKSFDPEFCEFEEQALTGKLSEAAKTSSMILLYEKFGHLKDAEGEAKGLYDAMHQKAILSAYYDLDKFDFPRQDISALKDLWNLKAGTGTLITVFYEYLEKDGNFAVHFCPDFYIQKKMRRFITRLSDSEREKNKSFLDTITLRVEQMPANYLPLAEIPENEWSINLLEEAFSADSIQVAARELDAVKSMADIVSGDFYSSMLYETFLIEYFIETHVPPDRNSISGIYKRLGALKGLLELQQKYDEKVEDLGDKDEALKEFQSEFGQEANQLYAKLRVIGNAIGFDGKPLSEVIDLYEGELREEIDFLTNKLPEENADRIVSAIINLYSAKRHLDFIAILKRFCEERATYLLKEVSFNNEKIETYLYTGECIGIKNSWKDFLADVESTKESFVNSIDLIKLSCKKMEDAILPFKELMEKQFYISYTDSTTYEKTCLGHLKELQRNCKRIIAMVQEFREKHDSSMILKFAEKDNSSYSYDHQNYLYISDYFDVDKFEFKGTLEAIDASGQLEFSGMNEIAGAVKPVSEPEPEDSGFLTGDNHSSGFNEDSPIQNDDPGFMTGDNHHNSGNMKPDKPFYKPNRPQIE